MPKIKAVTFDWGGVLADNVFNDLLNFYSSFLQVDIDRLRPVYEKYYHDFLVNRIKEPDFWNNICRDLQKSNPVGNGSLMRAAFVQAYKPHNRVIELVIRLEKKGYLLGLLSNAEAPAAKFFFDQDYLHFDAVVFSSMVGYEKPEQKIYRLLLDELGTKPEETIFIDDLEKNVQGARQAGLASFRFLNPEQVQAELAKFGVEI